MKYEIKIETNKSEISKVVNCKLEEAFEIVVNLLEEKFKNKEKYVYASVTKNTANDYKSYVYFIPNGKTKGEWK